MSNIDFSRPPPIGEVIPNHAAFTRIHATGITGPVIASEYDTRNGFSNNTIITPYTLYKVLQDPPVIGQHTPNDAYFNSINGPVIASMSDLYNGNNNKIVTPRTLTNYLASPGPIGGCVSSSACFSHIKVNGRDIVNELDMLMNRVLELERYEIRRLLLLRVNSDIVDYIMLY